MAGIGSEECIVFSIEYSMQRWWQVVGLVSREGEVLTFTEGFTVEGALDFNVLFVLRVTDLVLISFSIISVDLGAVEHYLSSLIDHHHTSLKRSFQEGLSTYTPKMRENWMTGHVSQTILLISNLWWSNDTTAALQQLSDGLEGAMEELLGNYESQVLALTEALRGDQTVALDKQTRAKFVQLLLTEVHQRDVTRLLVVSKTVNATAFDWRVQLRFSADEEAERCSCVAGDASVGYGFEFIGNAQRFVHTPQTDRCHLALMHTLQSKQAAGLVGDEGSGRCETIQQLSCTAAMLHHVFHSSDQFRSHLLGRIVQGVAGSGCWVTLDKAELLPCNVLAMLVTQLGTMLSALACLRSTEDSSKFEYEGRPCTLLSGAHIFLCMNRDVSRHWPLSMQALIRPVALVSPDLEVVCSVTLTANGFVNPNELAKKLVTLISLSKDLLTAPEYSWGIHTLRTILQLANCMPRSSDEGSSLVITAAVDYASSRLACQDLSVFHGLLNELFTSQSSGQGDPNDETEGSPGASRVSEAFQALKLHPLHPPSAQRASVNKAPHCYESISQCYIITSLTI